MSASKGLKECGICLRCLLGEGKRELTECPGGQQKEKNFPDCILLSSSHSEDQILQIMSSKTQWMSSRTSAQTLFIFFKNFFFCVDHFKNLSRICYILLLFCVFVCLFLPTRQAYGIVAPRPGFKPTPPASEDRVSTTHHQGSPSFLVFNYMYSN